MEDPEGVPEAGTITLSVPILEMIHQAQNLHGLKHHEYSRYRQHCSRRLRRIYKKTKFLHGRGKFQKKMLAPEMVKEVRHIAIPLVSAERAWAHAMDLKNEAETSPEQAALLRAHLRRRLSKATTHAASVLALARARCDEKTVLQAHAYTDLMGGRAALEACRWAEAARMLGQCRLVLLRLMGVGTVSEQAACKALMDEVEPAVRYCAHRLGSGPDAADRPLDRDLAARLAKLDIQGASVAAETAAAETGEAAGLPQTFAWRRLEVAVPDARTAAALGAAAEAETRVSAGASLALLEQVEALDHAANAYGEARNAIAAALAQSADAARLQELDRVVHGRVLELTLRRGRAVAELAAAGRRASQVRHLVGRMVPTESEARPEEAVRAVDGLLAAGLQLNELAIEIGGAVGEEIMDDAAAKISQFQAERCSAMAHVLLAAGQWRQAGSLFARTSELVSAAVQLHKECVTVDTQAIDGLHDLARSAAAFRAVAAAEAAAQAARLEDEAAAGVKGMDIQDEQAPRVAAATRYLSENWDAQEAFVGEGKGSVRIARVPPAPSVLPVRPIVLDAAITYIQPPSISHRLVKHAGAGPGVVSRLFGWGGAAKK